MYSLLPKGVRNTALIAFALVVILTWLAVDRIGLNFNAYRVASLVAATVPVAIVIIFGSSKYSSPWRWLWRKFPHLNQWVFPDLNGTWTGKTKSNWSVIQALRESAENQKSLDLAKLSEVELQDGDIAVQISASLFSLNVTSMSGNEGIVRSITAKAVRDDNSGDITIHYIFLAEMPLPSSTDEGLHKGAVSLTIYGPTWTTARGEYWTRRKWREGMNTAGNFEIVRVSQISEEPAKHLRRLISQGNVKSTPNNP